MAKAIVAKVKFQAPGGKATPAPPIGPALGQHGVNIGQFVSQFNERTRSLDGLTCPVELTVYKDKSFDFIIKSPPAAVLLLKAAKSPEGGAVEKGSGVPNKQKVGRVTKADVKRIAEQKLKDLNSFDVSGAMKQVEGTARSMGIEVAE